MTWTTRAAVILVAAVLISATAAAHSGSGQGWSVDVEQTAATCWSGNSSQGVRDITYPGNTSADTAGTVTFTGTIQTATPCHSIEHVHVERSGDTYTLNITTDESGGVCVQCVGGLTYEATFTAENPFRLAVHHNGDHVEDVWEDGVDDEMRHDPGDRNGPVQRLIAAIIDWLRSLF